MPSHADEIRTKLPRGQALFFALYNNESRAKKEEEKNVGLGRKAASKYHESLKFYFATK